MAPRLLLLALVAAAVAVPPASAAVASIDLGSEWLKGSSLENIPKQTFAKLLVENPQKDNTDVKSKNMTFPDTRVRNIKDQLIKAKVYLGLGAIRANPQYLKDLRQRIREVQKVLGDASKDSNLPKKFKMPLPNTCDLQQVQSPISKLRPLMQLALPSS